MPLKLEVEEIKEESLCEKCGAIMTVGQWPWCPHGSPSGHHHMIPYTVEIDGKPLTITSLQQATSIERETMQKYRNGEGQPLVFRTFHQDNSNKDRNTLDSMGVRQYDPRTPHRRGDRLPPTLKKGRLEE